MNKFVAYYRVSTLKQGQSGLGLEAQQATVTGFIGTGTVVATFIEVESGKKNHRPQLQAAIQAAKDSGSRLVIAKLDRLSRNAGFIFQLRDSGVDFVAADMPDANTLTIGIFAVIAQHERETISKRTKDALAAKKARGFILGTPANLTDDVRAQARMIQMENARTHKANNQARAIIDDKVTQGWTLQKIADYLNKLEYKTRRGKAFQPTTVHRLISKPQQVA